MKTPFILLALAMSLASSLNTEASDIRVCRIIFPERPKDAPKFAYLFDGETSQRVTLPSMNFSGIIELSPGNLNLQLTADKIHDIKEIPAGSPALEIADDIKDFYILVTADPSNALLPLRMELVAMGGGAFEVGQTLWCNLTDHAIQAKLGELDFAVAPKSREVSSSPLSESGYYRAEFKYQPGARGEFLKITEQQWWHDVGSRHLGFIVDSGGELPKIYFYRDFR
jgi:hypothetical protein